MPFGFGRFFLSFLEVRGYDLFLANNPRVHEVIKAYSLVGVLKPLTAEVFGIILL